MNIASWIVGIVIIVIACVFNIVTRVRLNLREFEAASTSQHIATILTSIGCGWLVGQVISYFLK